MDTNFTSGPWIVINPKDNGTFGDSCDGIETADKRPAIWACGDPEIDDEPTTIVETDGGFYAPRLADAFLIAAAPDMHLALRYCIARLEYYGAEESCAALTLARKALAKTEIQL